MSFSPAFKTNLQESQAWKPKLKKKFDPWLFVPLVLAVFLFSYGRRGVSECEEYFV